MSKPKTITALMVEDNFDHAELMLDTFEEFNIDNIIQHVIDGEQAIAYLRNTPPFEDKLKYTRPNIIFLDIRMPRQGGIETLKIIKNDALLSDIPVVMVSTSTTDTEKNLCSELGAYSYLNKPLLIDAFSKTMTELNLA